MNRRKAIGFILVAGAGGIGAVSAWKWVEWNKAPDTAWLFAHKASLTAIVDTILPPGNNIPGAAAAGVPDYILGIVKDCADTRTANTFIDGLKDTHHYCLSRFGKTPENCNADQRTVALQHFEEKGKPFKGLLGKAQQKYLGRSFFTILREYTVQGYVTSELGATKGFSYVAVPGVFHGCMPLQSGQRAWATK